MRRALIGLAVGLLALAGLAAAVPTARLRVAGWLAGDPVAEGQPVRYWVHVARTGGPEEKVKAFQVLGGLGAAAPAGTAAALAAGLADPDKAVRRSAAAALSQLPDGAEQADKLLAALNDPEIEVRAAAAIGLSNLTAGGPAAVAALIRMATDDPSGSNRIAALTCLSRYGPLAGPAVPVFMDALPRPDGPSGSPQQAACAALAAIGPAAVPAVVTALGHPSAYGREGAARALAMLKAAAAPALPTLRQRAGPEEPNPVVRLYAAKAISDIEGRTDAVLAAARVALKDQDKDVAAQERVRLAALYLLGELGPAAKDALADVLGILAADDNAVLRRFAALAAGKIDRGEQVRAALARATKDDQPEVCHAANQALQGLDGK